MPAAAGIVRLPRRQPGSPWRRCHRSLPGPQRAASQFDPCDVVHGAAQTWVRRPNHLAGTEITSTRDRVRTFYQIGGRSRIVGDHNSLFKPRQFTAHSFSIAPVAQGSQDHGDLS